MDDAENETWHLLALHRQFAGKAIALLPLLDHYGSATSLYARARLERRLGFRFRHPVLEEISRGPSREIAARVEKDLVWLSHPQHHLIAWGSAESYPLLLREIPDPPPLLFVDGDLRLLSSRQIAIVGSRNMSAAGRKTATGFAGQLARAGLTITSGLARGIDAAAHTGALEVGGKTIAVLGSGCDVTYPRQNRRLADRIRESGAVVSEFPLGTPGRAENFPRRNRIVTGLSVGTLVVEAASRSGSLISARLAAEQGRDVLAVPGSIFSRQSRGCHQLIKEGARLVESVEDIAEEIGGIEWTAGDNRPSQRPSLPDEVQARLYEALDATPSSVDDLVSRTRLDVPVVLAALIQLEVCGLVESGVGGYARKPDFRA
ncbi:MAG: DNA-processing protein DprA [Pseudomonadales bacterium]|nr:DNA-processing protein DprA [Pseudomonadales bacterium]